jgi:hypothetical protein
MQKPNTVEITIDKNRDEVVAGDKGIHITAENGIRIELPYEKVEVEVRNEKSNS